MALVRNRQPKHGLDGFKSDPVAASQHIYSGELIALNAAGNAVKITETTGLVIRGVAQMEVDNSEGIAGAKRVDTEQGHFGFLNSADADLITAAEIGDIAYAVDGQTVAKTVGGGRSPAGPILYIDNGYVFVDVGKFPAAGGTGLAAANNLSDVGSAGTARANIGANQWEQTIYIDDLVGADAKRYGFVAPKALTITKIKSVLLGAALTTGNATLTAKIAGVAVTSGVVTITQAGSAIGDVDTAAPSAANVAAEDQFVEVLVGGTNAQTTSRASVTFYGTY